ncbi:hypothetical protein [Fusibacter sp. 3D3]|uniref:hypothetical protein n=1 Tax=Fusibacter sp. 3D3 TaxID=1048380 RepID=UPI000852B44F|nr:hypothetical protein [Fusibacter sp. 3D3]GAU80095.1 5'-nucleotidase [Fusibacter sp. 3D3]
MSIIFKRFKARKYIGLFMAFITLIGTTNIPVSAVDTDTEHPVVSVQRTFLPAMPRHDYLISVDAEDNKGIEEVTITYTIFGKNTDSEGKTFSDQQMTKNDTNGRYEYNILGEQISYLAGGFTFYITATDVNSLKVTTESLSVSTTEYVNATTVTPSSYYENPRVYGVPAAEIFSIDGYISNDTEYPVIIVPTYFSPARPGFDYRISVIAQDNKGIQKVTVDYKMGEKSFNTREMTKSTINGRYEYKIPYTELSPHGTHFNFTVTATNMAGLKTTTDGSSNVYINARPNHVPKVDDYKVTVFTHTGNSNANNYTENPYDKPVPLPQNSEDDHIDKTYIESAPVTIKDVLALKCGTENITVTGQIAYFAKEYANPVIQSVIDGIPYSLYIYGATPTDAKIGDQVKLTGTYIIERGFPMLKLITAREIIGSDTPMAPEILTIEDLNTKGLDMLGRFIKVKSVKLGAYNAYGLTEITDATGTINIYKAAAFSTLVKEGDVVDLYATIGCVDSTVQLYTGTKESNGYTIYETITDTTPPTITVPDYYKEVRTGNLPFIIPAIVKDNKGIQKVTVTYIDRCEIKTKVIHKQN